MLVIMISHQSLFESFPRSPLAGGLFSLVVWLGWVRLLIMHSCSLLVRDYLIKFLRGHVWYWNYIWLQNIKHPPAQVGSIFALIHFVFHCLVYMSLVSWNWCFALCYMFGSACVLIHGTRRFCCVWLCYCLCLNAVLGSACVLIHGTSLWVLCDWLCSVLVCIGVLRLLLLCLAVLMLCLWSCLCCVLIHGTGLQGLCDWLPCGLLWRPAHFVLPL